MPTSIFVGISFLLFVSMLTYIFFRPFTHSEKITTIKGGHNYEHQ